MSSFVRSCHCALVLVALLLFAPTARADCLGPAECCIEDPSRATVTPSRVRLGIRVLRLRSVSDETSTYSADLALLMHWQPGGMRPDPHPRNAGAGYTTALDETRLVEGICYREQRLQGTFQTWIRLRRFPFDEQDLRLHLEERRATPGQVTYEPALWPNMIAEDALRELTGWRFDHYPGLHLRTSSFAYPASAPHPTLVVITLPIRRLFEYHLTRYFLPIFVIVLLAYGLFWIRPDDLGSAASVGVTCLLAIITFQITQADHLPRIAYLTIADRVYIVCYLATAFSIGAALRGAWLVATQRTELAQSLDRRWRWLFPVVFFLLLAFQVAAGWIAGGHSSDVPDRPPAPARPAGEPEYDSTLH